MKWKDKRLVDFMYGALVKDCSVLYLDYRVVSVRVILEILEMSRNNSSSISNRIPINGVSEVFGFGTLIVGPWWRARERRLNLVFSVVRNMENGERIVKTYKI